jgi:putative Holliday junction resolvase
MRSHCSTQHPNSYHVPAISHGLPETRTKHPVLAECSGLGEEAWYNRSMRYLGLDVGDRWVGMALSDPTGWLASPLETFRRVGRRQDLSHIARIIKEYDVEALVVGLPKNMNGSLGEQAERTMEFARELSALGKPITLWDERLSSLTALENVIAARGRGPRRGERLDAQAAAVILQAFLDSQPAAPRADDVSAAQAGAADGTSSA